MPSKKLLRIRGLTLHEGTRIRLPEKIVVKVNYVMKRYGFVELKPFILYLLNKFITEYFEKHPEELEIVRELEREYRILTSIEGEKE